MFNKPVIIIGAGPSGLTLARLLQMRGIQVRLFEHDASFEARDQGGSLDLHDNGGQKALFEAGLENDFKQLSRPEGQSFKLIDRNGKVHFENVARPDDQSRPEIDRQALRNILLNSLEPNTVIWVGADGTWSKVRPLLSPIQPAYAGVTIVEVRISNPKAVLPQIDELVGQGSAFVLSDNKGFMAQRNGDQSIRVYVAQRVPEDWMNRFDFNQPLAVREMLLDVFSGWNPELLEMLKHCDDKFVPRPIYALSLDEYWTTKPGLTIIGDAAHVMSPFAGQGANLAMLDALELANCLTSENCTNLTSTTMSIKLFEETMINRAREAAEETLAGLRMCLSEDAPAQMVNFMQSHHREEDR